MELDTYEIGDDTPLGRKLYAQGLNDTSRIQLMASATPPRDPLDTG